MSLHELTAEQIEELLAAAHQAYQHSYVPYSRFPVGAAVLTKPDAEGRSTIIKGCNVENASFGLAICAERVALTKAISEGHHQFEAIAVTAQHTNPCFPCGTCLQFIREFGADVDIFFQGADGQLVHYKIGEMLPYAFTSDDLPKTLQVKK